MIYFFFIRHNKLLGKPGASLATLKPNLSLMIRRSMILHLVVRLATATFLLALVSEQSRINCCVFKCNSNVIILGADGSVRLFDLRNLKTSTIIYDNRNRAPLLRLAWNRQDPNYIATFALDSKEVIPLSSFVFAINNPWKPALIAGGLAVKCSSSILARSTITLKSISGLHRSEGD